MLKKWFPVKNKKQFKNVKIARYFIFIAILFWVPFLTYAFSGTIFEKSTKFTFNFFMSSLVNPFFLISLLIFYLANKRYHQYKKKYDGD